jgi:hypothetical protein
MESWKWNPRFSFFIFKNQNRKINWPRTQSVGPRPNGGVPNPTPHSNPAPPLGSYEKKQKATLDIWVFRLRVIGVCGENNQALTSKTH